MCIVCSGPLCVLVCSSRLAIIIYLPFPASPYCAVLFYLTAISLFLVSQISFFYDQDVSNPANIFKLALKLQNFMAVDPTHGDKYMQDYLHPVMATAAFIWSYGQEVSQSPEDWSKANVAFLKKYTSPTSMIDIHKQEWKVSEVFPTVNLSYYNCCYYVLLLFWHL
jgi:hypothetical protein